MNIFIAESGQQNSDAKYGYHLPVALSAAAAWFLHWGA